MVLINGRKFRGNQMIRIALATKFFGIGPANAQQICSKLLFYPEMRMHQLGEQQILAISKELTNYTIDREAKREVLNNIAIKRDIGSYAGMRHSLSLPVRGQRTRSNARTARRLNHIKRRLYSTDASPSPSKWSNWLAWLF